MTSTYQRPDRATLPGRPLLDDELETLRLASLGLTNARIGARLHRSEDAIKSRMRQVFAKLDARDRAHAVRRGFELGLLTAEPDKQVAS